MMMTLLILLIPIIGSVTAVPLPDIFDNSEDQKISFPSPTRRSDTMNENPDTVFEKVESTNEISSILNETTEHLEAANLMTHDSEFDKKADIQGRKHKAIFIDHPLLPHISHYSKVPAYKINYNDNSKITGTEGSSSGSKRYQESNIFYIRLPPTPYMYVPGLGYVSQPPTYSTIAALKPQVVKPQLLQLPPQVKPARPSQPQAQSASSQQTVNPFIKLPIDFVSNGKPTSVYQWQKKPSRKPADSPITNLDNLSANFVSNGKPTSIYQWQTNLKPVKRPNDSLNSLEMGPYTFNGKLTSLYLLGPDGSSSMRQTIRYPDYQNDYRNAYY